MTQGCLPLSLSFHGEGEKPVSQTLKEKSVWRNIVTPPPDGDSISLECGQLGGNTKKIIKLLNYQGDEDGPPEHLVGALQGSDARIIASL